MQVKHCKLITPPRFGDRRGFFGETYNRRRYAEMGIDVEFVQDNHSLSREVGTLRGLHFQSPPHAQAKLVRCGGGAIFDVAVDIRRSSLNFGRWFGVKLTSDNHKQLYIPAGFAHGFCVLSPIAEMAYKCTALYVPADDASLRWNDPAIGIEWPIQDPILSAKDSDAPMLQEIGDLVV